MTFIVHGDKGPQDDDAEDCRHDQPTAAIRCAVHRTIGTREASFISNEKGECVAMVTHDLRLVTKLLQWEHGKKTRETSVYRIKPWRPERFSTEGMMTMTRHELAKMLYETHVESGAFAGGVKAFPWEELTQEQKAHWTRTTENLIAKLKAKLGGMAGAMLGKLIT